MLQSRYVSLQLKKQIVRVCLDSILFYSTENMILTKAEIKLFESARLYVLRTMRRITRYDQHIYHISGKRMRSEMKMASAYEKIMRRHFRFIAKIINKSPLLSPERMLMGSPKLIWRRDDYEIDLKPNTWNPAFGKTIASIWKIGPFNYTIMQLCERKKQTWVTQNQLSEQCLVLRVHKRE